MAEPLDPIQEAAACVEAAREQLRKAAEILRGPSVEPTYEHMRAEQQVTRAMDALWGVRLLP